MIQSLSFFSPFHHAMHGCSAILRAMAVEIVMQQRLSRERAQLAEMDRTALKDIGLTSADVMAELEKPVWRR